jgi:hypothetical protein
LITALSLKLAKHFLNHIPVLKGTSIVMHYFEIKKKREMCTLIYTL